MSELLVFMSKRRIERLKEAEARDARRAADRIAAAFYEACRIGNLDAAGQLMQALEREAERSARLPGADAREDGHDLADVRARFEIETARSLSLPTPGP